MNLQLLLARHASVTTNARLAAAVAAFILAEEAMEAARLPDGYYPRRAWAARRQAFNALKTIFETEFPHV